MAIILKTETPTQLYYYGSDYMRHVLSYESLDEIIAELEDEILKSKIKFDSIAVKGNSGTLVAGALSIRLKRNLVLVRKNDGSHSGRSMEGFYSSSSKGPFAIDEDDKHIRYIIIDDLIATGDTILEIHSKLGKRQLVGVFLYAQDSEYGKEVKKMEKKLKCPIFVMER